MKRGKLRQIYLDIQKTKGKRNWFKINNFNHYEQQKEKIHSPGRGNPTVLV